MANPTTPSSSEIATEQNRFNVVPMGHNLTIECARRFKKQLLQTGGDDLETDLITGRAYYEVPDEEVQEKYLDIPANFRRIEK